MTKRDFLKENKDTIDNIIHKLCGDNFSINDGERWNWVQNDEGLYNWARSEGVRV